jgi:hypothetical protein
MNNRDRNNYTTDIGITPAPVGYEASIILNRAPDAIFHRPREWRGQGFRKRYCVATHPGFNLGAWHIQRICQGTYLCNN